MASAKQKLKRALRDPGLRSKLPASKLTPKLRAQRALNVRLAQPITPGSSITERDLARESKVAAAVKYGPQERALQSQLGAAQQTQRDVGGFYDQYLARLAQNQRDISSIQQGVQTGLQGVAQGITGLSASGLQSLQSQADQSATARGATAGDLSTLASNAAATRQALIGSFQAQQQLVGGAEQGYASQLANVVGPGQKLQAVAQQGQKISKARQDILDLATEKGQADYLYRQQARQAEAKNVLAKAIATGKTNIEQQRITSQERQTTQRLTSQERQTQARLEAQARQGTLNRQNQRELQRLRDKGKRAAGKGPDWHTQSELGTALTQLTGLKSAAQKAKTGQLFEPPPGGQKRPGTALDRHAAARKILGYGPIAAKLKDPILVTAALDAVYDGHLSAATIKALIKAGYKPSRVAQTLGVPTAGQYKPPPRRAAHIEPGKAIPVIGGAVR